MYRSPWKFFRNQILLVYSGRWRNQSCQIVFQSVHPGVSGKGSNFAIFSANRRWPLQLLYYRTTVINCLDNSSCLYVSTLTQAPPWRLCREVALNKYTLHYITLMFCPARPVVINWSVGPARSNFIPARPVVRRLVLVRQRTNQSIKLRKCYFV